ncbi:hypothetical protein [Ammoniphilus sp. 3BR4]|uniref:hypothetical protein n=1 Tax=Ammoniphilus sp. 3BR4 TaxID=3158265 RepID=UPI00346609D8
MDTKSLQKFIQEHDVFQRTIKGFWHYLNTWKAKDQSDFEKCFSGIDFNSLKVKVKKVSLTINYRYDEPLEYVQSYASVVHNDEEIAVYHFLLTLEGEYDDDVLSWTVLE